jgi:site-specific recombinase XerD
MTAPQNDLSATAAAVRERLEEEAAHARLAAWHAQRREAGAAGDDRDEDEETDADPPTPGAAGPAEVEAAPPAPRLPADKVSRHHKLHRGHFTFLRAYVQGLDVAAMWDRYMAINGAATDLRSVRRGLRLLREDMAAAAMRFNQVEVAQLLADIEVDITKLPDVQPAKLPTLEEFIFERGLDGEREAEQLHAYHEEYGEPSERQQIHALRMTNLIAALWKLEFKAAEKPAGADPVDAWLREEMAEPLKEAGVTTLRQLVDRVNGLGHSWAAGLRAIGAGKASRIVAWLRDPDHNIGVPIGAHALAPRDQVPAEVLRAVVAPATAVVPIDKFIVPPALDGSAGVFRGPKPCMLTADTDFHAMLAYVRSKPGLSAAAIADLQERERAAGAEPGPAAPLAWLRYLSKTQAGILAEIYRFMLWSIIERGKATSSINMEDAAAYRDFLANPAPADRWSSGARGREKYLPSWRPFAGPLSPATADKALKTLGAWYNYLHRSGYQTANPFTGVKAAAAPAQALAADRGFTQHEWAYINGQLAALAPTSANRRLRFGMRLMYATGMRCAEVVGAQVQHLRWASYPPTVDDPEWLEGWELGIVGKGNKPRVVPVPDIVIADLTLYLASRGLPADLRAPESKRAHLLGQAIDVAEQAPWSPAAQTDVDPLAGIGAQTWYDSMKAFFRRCADQLQAHEPDAAAQLARASTHFLRHSRISHSLEAGTAQHIERDLAGHSSLDTTSSYAHTNGKQRMRGSAHFFASAGVQGTT